MSIPGLLIWPKTDGINTSINKKQTIMKKQFDIEKSATGYTVNITSGRGSFAAATLSGVLTLEISNELAATISNALYTPKKRTAGAVVKETESKMATEKQVKDAGKATVAKAIKPMATTDAATPTKNVRRSRAKKEHTIKEG
jgi:hypothetical protein